MHKRHMVLGGTQGTVTLVRSQEKILCAGEIPLQGQWIQGATRNSRVGAEDLVIYRVATLVIWNDRGIFSPNFHQPSYTRVLVDPWPSTYCTSLLWVPVWSPPVRSNTKHSQTNCSRVSHSLGCHRLWGRDSGNWDKSKTLRLTMKLKRPRLSNPSTLQFQIALGLWYEVRNGILAEYQPLRNRSLAQSCSNTFWEASGAIHGSQ
ncbi:hypothetical protein BGZ57DRAFT_207409 [Hyaloscypha finlandica]|nr:hypothetical protein BGZ57DRAFT_207409 [Hyaloscypha finlandica]